MRNFDERKSEIFRRSENRIKLKRQKRNNFLALCIPLFFILTVFSVTVLPKMFSAKTAPVKSNSQLQSNVEYSQTKYLFSSVEVVSNHSSKVFSNITDPATATNAYDSICGIFAPFEMDDAVDSSKNDISTDNTLKDDSDLKTDNGYTINFISSKGTIKTYTLDGNELYDNSLNIKITLTSEELFSLNSVLGITSKEGAYSYEK